MSKRFADISDLKTDYVGVAGAPREGESHWDQVEAYLDKGYLPPIYFNLALDFSREIGATERYIIRCMLRSIHLQQREVKAAWVKGSKEHMDLWGHMAAQKGMLQVRIDSSHRAPRPDYGQGGK